MYWCRYNKGKTAMEKMTKTKAWTSQFLMTFFLFFFLLLCEFGNTEAEDADKEEKDNIRRGRFSLGSGIMMMMEYYEALGIAKML
mmetsp:Transcript_23706/g.58112  ORF Transcript_23706/g.58112 Transcript_23706/m.58112 type:complete len:85 (-) Transcript_23706:102-356(-)